MNVAPMKRAHTKRISKSKDIGLTRARTRGVSLKEKNRKAYKQMIEHTESNDNRNWFVTLLDAVAGVDNAGIEVTNTVSDVRRATQMRKSQKRVRKSKMKQAREASKSSTTIGAESVDVWDIHDGSDSEDDLDWQSVVEKKVTADEANLGSMSMWL